MASLREPGAILLVSCYELGHQPMALASPAAHLRSKGFEPALLDLAQTRLDEAAVRRARLIAISVPMHTALRLGVRAAEKARLLNPEAHLCFYGLYATLNAADLLARGADAVIGGEYEAPLARLAESLESGAGAPLAGVRTAAHPAGPHLEKIERHLPDRRGLPPIGRYVRVEVSGETRLAGQVEASRGCLHLCRHCPIPPVYGGRFFVVPRDLVMADVRAQVAAGARHITFADPDFLNGPGHALALARELHAGFPEITFDVTTKVEHLVKHRDRLPELRRLGCLFIVSAVESLSDRVLAILDKGHARADLELVLGAAREAGITLRPTFVPFTPWTTLSDYSELLEFIERHDLIDAVDPVQLSIRLLVPPGSLLAEHAAFLPHRGPLADGRFTYRWSHPDPRLDRLQIEIARIVEQAAAAGEETRLTFEKIVAAAAAAGAPFEARPERTDRPTSDQPGRPRPPRLTEPWFCCAEPTEGQLEPFV